MENHVLRLDPKCSRRCSTTKPRAARGKGRKCGRNGKERVTKDDVKGSAAASSGRKTTALHGALASAANGSITAAQARSAAAAAAAAAASACGAATATQGKRRAFSNSRRRAAEWKWPFSGRPAVEAKVCAPRHATPRRAASCHCRTLPHAHFSSPISLGPAQTTPSLRWLLMTVPKTPWQRRPRRCFLEGRRCVTRHACWL